MHFEETVTKGGLNAGAESRATPAPQSAGLIHHEGPGDALAVVVKICGYPHSVRMTSATGSVAFTAFMLVSTVNSPSPGYVLVAARKPVRTSKLACQSYGHRWKLLARRDPVGTCRW